MRVLLRKTETQTYYAGPGRWVLNQAQAHDFYHASLALDRALAERLAGVELLLTYDTTGAEVVLPVHDRDKAQPPRRRGIDEHPPTPTGDRRPAPTLVSTF